MTIFVITLSIIALVIVLSIAWFIADYNRLVRLYALVTEGWSGVDVQLKRRADLIPNVVNTVKGYSIHEKDVLENVTRMRAQSMQATTIEGKIAAEQQLSQALRSLAVVVEQYPNLKANENFLALQKNLDSIEQDIQLARRYYNGTVRNYNIWVQRFPSNIVARFTGFVQATYFQITNDQDRDVPRVNF